MENKFNVKSAVFLAVLLLVAVVAAAYIVTANWDKISNGSDVDLDGDSNQAVPADNNGDDQTVGEAIDEIFDASEDDDTTVEVNNSSETQFETTTDENGTRFDENGIEMAP